jgi:hypothetical protein
LAARLALTSELQEEILTNVCRHGDADLKTLMNDVNRDRITIWQSLRLLVGGFYVRKLKIGPGKKSKLYFYPTEKGVCYALAFLDLDVNEVNEKLVEGNRLREFIDLVKHMRNREGARVLLKNLAQMSIIDNSFVKGNLPNAIDNLFIKSVMVTAYDMTIPFNITIPYDMTIPYLVMSIFNKKSIPDSRKNSYKLAST